MTELPDPDPDRIQPAARGSLPGDDQLANLSCEQVERCAALVAAYARGHDGYRDALPDVARLLILAGVTARAGIDGAQDNLVAAWATVDAWPFPRHGAPRLQPR